MSDKATVDKVSMKDVDKVIGRYAIMYRDNKKVPAKILGVDLAEKRLIYELLGGPDKGKKKSSKYDEAQTADIYDEENLTLALLET